MSGEFPEYAALITPIFIFWAFYTMAAAEGFNEYIKRVDEAIRSHEKEIIVIFKSAIGVFITSLSKVGAIEFMSQEQKFREEFDAQLKEHVKRFITQIDKKGHRRPNWDAFKRRLEEELYQFMQNLVAGFLDIVKGSSLELLKESMHAGSEYIDEFWEMIGKSDRERVSNLLQKYVEKHEAYFRAREEASKYTRFIYMTFALMFGFAFVGYLAFIVRGEAAVAYPLALGVFALYLIILHYYYNSKCRELSLRKYIDVECKSLSTRELAEFLRKLAGGKFGGR